MNLKKVKIINVILLMGLSFLWHFIYDWCPNFITSVFFPVNESIWEHMKIIFGCFVVVSLISLFICKKCNIQVNNKYAEILVKGALGIALYLLIFVPVYKLIGESMIFAISLMFVVYVVMEFIGYQILTYRELGLNFISIVLIILVFIMLGVLTYYPFHNFLFIDSRFKEYGILSINKKSI